MNNKEKKLLIFDYDGVIVDSIEIIHKIFNNLRGTYNLPYFKTRDDIAKLLDKNFFETLSGLGFSKERAQVLLQDIKEQKITYENKLHLFPHMRNLLQQVSSLYPCIIITSTHEETVASFLKKHDLDRYVSLVLGGNSETSKIKKIEKALKQFSVDKQNAYFISDTTGDIEEGKKAGVTTIGVTWGYHNKEKILRSAPDYVFTTVTELQDFLVHI